MTDGEAFLYSGFCLYCGAAFTTRSLSKRFCTKDHADRERRAVRMLAGTTPAAATHHTGQWWVKGAAIRRA